MNDRYNSPFADEEDFEAPINRPALHDEWGQDAVFVPTEQEAHASAWDASELDRTHSHEFEQLEDFHDHEDENEDPHWDSFLDGEDDGFEYSDGDPDLYGHDHEIEDEDEADDGRLDDYEHMLAQDFEDEDLGYENEYDFEYEHHDDDPYAESDTDHETEAVLAEEEFTEFLPALFCAEGPEDEPDFEGEDPLPTNSSDGWVVPPDILRIGRSHPEIKYNDAPDWSDNKRQCTGRLTSGARKLSAYIEANFPGIRRIGGYNCRRNTARRNKTSIHGTGRALDIMIPTIGGKANSAVGDPIARWLIVHAPAIGIQYFIWNNVQWSGKKRKFRVYITEAERRRGTGKGAHRDHLHVELNEAAAAERTPWFAANKVLLDNTFNYQGAIRKNARYAKSLGWQSRRGDIAQWLGLSTRNPGNNPFIDAVRKFQEQHNLGADGVIGPKTWAAIQRAFNSPAGGPSFDVDRAERLNARYAESLGWDDRLADITQFLNLGSGQGDGAELARAIAKWQASKGLKVDGIMGPNTWARMKRSLGGASSSGSSSASAAAVQGAAAAAAAAGAGTSAPPARSPGGAVKKRPGGWDGWKGQRTGGTVKISAADIRDKYDRAVAVAAQVETGGYYDLAQMYDKGILSWGIKQWTLHRGSLQKLLGYIRTNLDRQGQGNLWSTLFPGLDIRSGKIVVNGTTLATPRKDDDAADIAMRRVFRGSASASSFDNSVMNGWLDMFARAGRHSTIQKLMFQYAVEDLKATLNRDLGDVLRRRRDIPAGKVSDYGRVGDYLETVPLAITMFNGMETQNPKWTFRYLRDNVDRFAKKYRTYDISRWPSGWQGEFSERLKDEFVASGVACWGMRAKNKKAHCQNRTTRSKKLLNAHNKISP